MEFSFTDLRDQKSFPNLDYRYSRVDKGGQALKLSRDFMGENPLHYYLERGTGELIAANGVLDILEYLGKSGRKFEWGRLRTVQNNSSATIDSDNFKSGEICDNESGPTLQEYELPYDIDYSNLGAVGEKIRELLDNSIEKRLSTINERHIGMILSGGLDSISVGYLLSGKNGIKVTAFTLHVGEGEADIVQSRKLAAEFGIDLVEVKVSSSDNGIALRARKYNPGRELIYEREIANGLSPQKAFHEAVAICANSNKDNALCAVSMHLIARAILEENIGTVFCGEGPNEMINDYGFVPSNYGFKTSDKSDIRFRETLTFGGNKLSRQLGRGGLGNYAVSRMGKVFARHGMRLECPYFDREIARIMTRVPHLTSYDTIKQHLVQKMFPEDGLDDFIMGTSKMMFQDGSGVRKLFSGYDDKKTGEILRGIYGIKSPGALDSLLRRISIS